MRLPGRESHSRDSPGEAFWGAQAHWDGSGLPYQELAGFDGSGSGVTSGALVATSPSACQNRGRQNVL